MASSGKFPFLFLPTTENRPRRPDPVSSDFRSSTGRTGGVHYPTRHLWLITIYAYTYGWKAAVVITSHSFFSAAWSHNRQLHMHVKPTHSRHALMQLKLYWLFHVLAPKLRSNIFTPLEVKTNPIAHSSSLSALLLLLIFLFSFLWAHSLLFHSCSRNGIKIGQGSIHGFICKRVV